MDFRTYDFVCCSKLKLSISSQLINVSNIETFVNIDVYSASKSRNLLLK